MGGFFIFALVALPFLLYKSFRILKIIHFSTQLNRLPREWKTYYQQKKVPLMGSPGFGFSNYQEAMPQEGRRNYRDSYFQLDNLLEFLSFCEWKIDDLQSFGCWYRIHSEKAWIDLVELPSPGKFYQEMFLLQEKLNDFITGKKTAIAKRLSFARGAFFDFDPSLFLHEFGRNNEGLEWFLNEFPQVKKTLSGLQCAEISLIYINGENWREITPLILEHENDIRGEFFDTYRPLEETTFLPPERDELVELCTRNAPFSTVLLRMLKKTDLSGYWKVLVGCGFFLDHMDTCKILVDQIGHIREPAIREFFSRRPEHPVVVPLFRQWERESPKGNGAISLTGDDFSGELSES